MSSESNLGTFLTVLSHLPSWSFHPLFHTTHTPHTTNHTHTLLLCVRLLTHRSPISLSLSFSHTCSPSPYLSFSAPLSHHLSLSLSLSLSLFLSLFLSHQ